MSVRAEFVFELCSRFCRINHGLPEMLRRNASSHRWRVWQIHIGNLASLQAQIAVRAAIEPPGMPWLAVHIRAALVGRRPHILSDTGVGAAHRVSILMHSSRS